MTPTTSPTSPIDILCIGTGPSALAFGAGVSRLLHPVIFFSSPTKPYRNALSHHMHNVPTWDHRDPVDFRAAVRKELVENYTTNYFEDVGIERIERCDAEGGRTLFKATDERGKEWWGRKVVIATGIRDEMLGIEGYEACWGSGIFHCLFCHGYEERGTSSAGVLAIDDCAPGKVAMHMARYTNQLAEKVTIYSNGNPTVTKDLNDVLASCKPESKSRRCITVEERKIAKFVKGTKAAEVEIHFEDGEMRKEGFLAHKPKSVLNGGWVEQLGLETVNGDIKVNFPFNETSVPGVFAIGDCATVMKAVMIGMSMGGAAAGGVAAQLEAED